MPKANTQSKAPAQVAKVKPQVVDQPKSTLPVQDKFTKLDFPIPDSKEFLKAGVQFGHQVSRWNPKMKKYIYTQRGNIHIIDIAKTSENLQKALLTLVNAASKGEVLFVGTKRQAREIIKASAVEAGAYYIIHRWVGGLLTNYNYTDRSLKKLNKLEQAFETGVQGHTKFEVSLMKKEWERLNRLYEGVKGLNRRPTAIVILDSKYEKNAVKEATLLNIPIISVVDTNADPDQVNYPIPGNDDALSAIKLYFDLFVKAVKQGNNGKGVHHLFKDYSKMDVVIKKVDLSQKEEGKEIAEAKTVVEKDVATKTVQRQSGEGILESVQKAKEIAKTVVVEPEKKADASAKKTAKKNEVKAEEKAEKEVVKKVAKKTVKKVAKKEGKKVAKSKSSKKASK